MKIIYIAFMGDLSSIGVIKKVISQIQYLNSQGVKTKGIFLYSSKKNMAFYKNYEYVQFVRNSKNDRVNMHNIEKILNKEGKFDLIYFRYPRSTWSLFKFTKKYSNKVIFEHQTKELSELKLSQYKYKATRFWNIYLSEMIFAPLVFKYSAGVVGVTEEISLYEKQRSLIKNLKVKTVSNGIDVASNPLRQAPIFDGKDLRILFASGYASRWHGIDRIIQSLAQYSGNVNITLYIIGPVLNEIRKLVSELNLTNNVVFLPKMSASQFDKYFDYCHIAIGSLGLHRINLVQGAVLKTREYVARGIPFIIGYEDIDLTRKKKISPYFLKVPADDQAIDMNQIINFTKEVFSIPEHAKEMREFALSNMDMSVKMKQLKKVLISFYKSSKFSNS